MQLPDLIERAESIAGGTRKLAAVLGESASNISKWKTGARHCPDEKVVRLAQIAGLPVERTFKEVAWQRVGKLASTAANGAAGMYYILGGIVGALSVAPELLRTMYRKVNSLPVSRGWPA